MRTLVAVEPLLIAGRVTCHPADWAMAVRIWPSAVRPADRPWRYLASAIHEHGIPVLSLDPESTAKEIQCQILLLAHWHKYVGPGEPEIADVIAAAYPQAAERIQRATRCAGCRCAPRPACPADDRAVAGSPATRRPCRDHERDCEGVARRREVLAADARLAIDLCKHRASRITSCERRITASPHDSHCRAGPATRPGCARTHLSVIPCFGPEANMKRGRGNM